MALYPRYKVSPYARRDGNGGLIIDALLGELAEEGTALFARVRAGIGPPLQQPSIEGH